MAAIIGLDLLVICLLCGGCRSASSSAAERYLVRLGQQLEQLSPLGWTAAAESAAERLIAGGRIWAAGPQAGFAVEAFNRAGGLNCLGMLKENAPEPADVVLYALAAPLAPEDAQRIKAWREAGVQIVVFDGTPALPAGLPVRDSGVRRLCPTDTLLNVVNMWVWTGELVAACTRRGRMPVLFQSYGIDGGRARGKKYSGKTFHDDFEISPIPAGTLGRAYVDTLEKILDQVRDHELDKLSRIASWWRATPPDRAVALTLGHLYPDHFKDQRAPQRIGFDHQGPLNGMATFVLHVGYQDAPQKLIDEARSANCHLAYMSVQSAEPAEPSANIIYVNPRWPLDDACVPIEGYDIPILPASGVINAAIYWSILAESVDSD